MASVRLRLELEPQATRSLTMVPGATATGWWWHEATRMLKVFYANKPEALLAQLQIHLEQEVGIPPRDLFTPVKLIVASRPLETWLKHQLVVRAGIVANLETRLLRRFSTELVERAFPERAVLDGDAIRDLLLARFLDGDVAAAELGPVRGYLGSAGDGAAAELRAVQLAAQLGHVLEEYVFSRREMLAAWATGESSPLDGGGELASWQRRLWQQVLATAEPGRVLPTRLLELAPETLVTPGVPLFVFGLSFLGTSYHELLVHLARATDVFLFTLTPCMEFWEDVTSARDRSARFSRRADAVTLAALATDDPFQLREDECRPLALWGRPGREAVRLLTQATHGVSEGIFIDPAAPTTGMGAAAAGPGSADGHAIAHPSLLRRLQSDMLHRRPTRRAEAGPAMTPFDGIELAPCPSLRRECEFVAGRCWALLASEPRAPDALRLDDIAVVIAANDAEAYVAPLLAAFRENHDLPWQLVGIASALTSPLVEAALLLLELPLSRFTRADVLRVLTHPVVVARFPDVDVDAWVRWVDALGIVHGESHADHAATYIERDLLNWDQGLRRLALGAFLSTRADNDERMFELDGERYLPDPAGAHVDGGAGALLLLARALLADARTLRDATLSVLGWADALATLFATYLIPRDDPERRALDACLRIVRGVATRGLGERPLSFQLARELVRAELATAGSSIGGGITGGVRLSTLQAARGIPARVTFIVGLSEGSFPASDRAEALDLRPQKPLVGDASSREKDQYLFLEAVLATRDRLVLSYLARDERTGDARNPSPVVVELRRLLDSGYLGRADDDASPHPLVHHVPLWRADARAEDDARIAPSEAGLVERRLRAAGAELRERGGPTPPGTSARTVTAGLAPAARAELVGALALLPAPARAPVAVDAVRRVSLSQLRAYLDCPLQGAAKVRLRLSADEDADGDARERTDEVFNSSAGTTVTLLRQVFVDAWRAAGGGAFPVEDEALEAAWHRRAEPLVAQGELPLGVFLDVEAEDGLEVLQRWRGHLAPLAPGADRPLRVVRFGAADEHEPIEEVRDAPVFELAVPGPGGERLRVELVGATQPLVGWDRSLLLIRRKAKGEPPVRQFGEIVRAWIDHVVLVASGVVEPGPHHVALAYRDTLVVREIAPLTCDEARAYLAALLHDLLLGDNELLAPFAAVFKYGAGGGEFGAIVADLMDGREPSCAGPLRRVDRFRIPAEDEAAALIARRFAPLFTRLDPSTTADATGDDAP